MSELISTIKNQLHQMVPNAKTIWIKVERDYQWYLTKTHLHLPGAV